MISLGCYLRTFAIPLLLTVFVLQAIELGIRLQGLSVHKPALKGMQKWRRVFAEDLNSSMMGQVLASTSGLLLVVFFISQLSYLLNHCE